LVEAVCNNNNNNNNNNQSASKQRLEIICRMHAARPIHVMTLKRIPFFKVSSRHPSRHPWTTLLLVTRQRSQLHDCTFSRLAAFALQEEMFPLKLHTDA